jgi:hypothetical protein
MPLTTVPVFTAAMITIARCALALAAMGQAHAYPAFTALAHAGGK